MKRPTPDQLKQTLDSFYAAEPTPELVLLDRSNLERYSECPAQAVLLESGEINGHSSIANSGNEGHEALSRVTLAWIESNGAHSPTELRNEVETELWGSRPDVQPDAISAVLYSAWSWGKFLSEIHPSNIIRFDGGETLNRSGQLSYDFADLGVRVTSELDLLFEGPSVELLHEVDYKTGHTRYTAADVASSFQFQLHAVLVFANYPNVLALEMQVWNTRLNERTYRVVFKREKEPQYRARVRMAVQSWYEHHANPNPPAWPALEKCSCCDAAHRCPAAGDLVRDIAADPMAVLVQLIAVEAKADKMRKTLTAYVDTVRGGKDLEWEDAAFGRNKPAEKRRESKLYKLKENRDAQGT